MNVNNLFRFAEGDTSEKQCMKTANTVLSSTSIHSFYSARSEHKLSRGGSRRKDLGMGQSPKRYFPSHPFLSPFPLPFLPSLPIKMRLGCLGERISSTSGSRRSWSPNVFWCIVSISLHFFTS